MGSTAMPPPLPRSSLPLARLQPSLHAAASSLTTPHPSPTHRALSPKRNRQQHGEGESDSDGPAASPAPSGGSPSHSGFLSIGSRRGSRSKQRARRRRSSAQHVSEAAAVLMGGCRQAVCGTVRASRSSPLLPSCLPARRSCPSCSSVMPTSTGTGASRGSARCGAAAGVVAVAEACCRPGCCWRLLAHRPASLVAAGHPAAGVPAPPGGGHRRPAQAHVWCAATAAWERTRQRWQQLGACCRRRLTAALPPAVPRADRFYLRRFLRARQHDLKRAQVMFLVS